MTSLNQSKRIVWLLRALIATGLIAVISIVALVSSAVHNVRAERAVMSREQTWLSNSLDRLRRFCSQSRVELQSTLDSGDMQSDIGTASINLQTFLKTSLESHPSAAVVGPLHDLNSHVAKLTALSGLADSWRTQYEQVSADIANQRTLTVTRQAIGQLKLELDDSPKSDSAALADKLNELALLTEAAAGEERLGSLDSLSEKQIKPAMESLRKGIAELEDDAMVESVDALALSLIGRDKPVEEFELYSGVIPMRSLALRLREQRENLKQRATALFEDIESANGDFSKVAHERMNDLAVAMELNIARTRTHVLIFGAIASIAFFYLATRISKGIHSQVRVIDQSRAEADYRRLIADQLLREQKAAAIELEETHRQLVKASHQAGMAEVATGVLHNVGNVLNSVNVSANVVSDTVRMSRSASLKRLAGLFREHQADIGTFITSDPGGKQIPNFVVQLAEVLADEQSTCLKELQHLLKNIDHIKEVVAMQQSHAKGTRLSEKVNIEEIVEDALRMNLAGIQRHEIRVKKEFAPVPQILSDKHKILQILINLIGNAKHAMRSSEAKDLTITMSSNDGGVRITVRDTGYGIPKENLTRIFNHGFTTKKDGHGFGLHSGAVAAKELGGSLNVHSDGPGHGAEFILELPLSNMESAPAATSAGELQGQSRPAARAA